jgi:uncharacterized protein
MENILSFKDEVTFSMVAAPIREKNDRLKNNVFKMDNKYSLLKTATIYGANASGKSNVIKGFINFQSFILDDALTIKDNDQIEIPPFRLILNSEINPIKFDVVIKENDTLYKYGIILNTEEILEEYLTIKKTRETEVFSRNKNEYKVSKKYRKMNELVKKKMIPKNSLLIARAAQFNEEIAINFMNGLNNLRTISDIEDKRYKKFSIDFAKRSIINSKLILELLKVADSTITNFKNDGKDRILIERKLYDKDSNSPIGISAFFLDNFESQGTQKFFHISGPIINTLHNGHTLFLDELDSKLHPLLVEKIIELFNNLETNPKNAQLIFTTHNTSLLSAKLFRRDQIWLTEKNEYGVSDLYSLADFKDGLKSIRNDESIEKNYLTGKYGGIPFLGNFDDIKINKE